MKLSFLFRRLEKLFHIFRFKPLIKSLLEYQVLAGTEHRHCLKKKFSTIVDVGANRGQFALAARNWAGNAHIFSFEPLAEAANQFRRLFNGDHQVTLHQAAIAPESDRTIIHVAASDDSSSLLPISPLQEQLFPGTGEVRKESVRTGPLSAFVRPQQIVSPAMLKLDVQGYELEALRGCETLLPKFSYVYVECSFLELYFGQPLADDIIIWLGERGWRLSGVYNMVYDRQGRSIQADFLFQNQSSPDSA